MAHSFAASVDDPVSGGRHKVLGSANCFIPPQTSTIASHLPKAVGAAHSIGISKKIKHQGPLPHDSIIIASFGDASANHSTAQGAFNAAQWASFQGAPMPIVFICEDNNIGISVTTPHGWIKTSFQNRPGITYYVCDGTDIAQTYHTMCEAVGFARRTRSPVFLHMKTIRLMGHAGADIEAAYTAISQLEKTEARDPLLRTAHHLIARNILTADEIIARYEAMSTRVARVSASAQTAAKLSSAKDVMASLVPPKAVKKTAPLSIEKNQKAHGKPITLSKHINQALADLMVQYPNLIAFGEDVGKKGGVYGVTTGLQDRFGPARIFDTLLDEQSILGLAIGMAHNGLIPVPEIQFLAYLHNAEDQVRGEAATLSFFSNGQYTNPCVIRIAGLGYQKGFGGHFHNDNSFAVLRDIPGITSNGKDAAEMLRECVRLAYQEQRVVVFLEPIALYNTPDLHAPGDGAWLSKYSPPKSSTAKSGKAKFGKIHIHSAEKNIKTQDLCILSYANGYYLSRIAQPILKAEYNINARICDLRWLHPLPEEEILKAIEGVKSILIVDECRKTGSISEQIITLFQERNIQTPIARLTAEDSFIPLGPAAYEVLPSVDQIVGASCDLWTRVAKPVTKKLKTKKQATRRSKK